MLRKKLLVTCLATAVLCLTGIVLAKAVKVELAPYPAAAPLEPDASGHVILNYAKGTDKTIVQMNCWGLMSEAEYTVYLYNGGFYAVGSFTTRTNGSGNLHVTLEGDASGHLPAAINNAGGATVLLSL